MQSVKSTFAVCQKYLLNKHTSFFSNRFSVYILQPPVPVKPWQGEYDASVDKLPCVQPYLESVGPVSEDRCV